MRTKRNPFASWQSALLGALFLVSTVSNAQAWHWWWWWKPNSTPNLLEKLEADGRFETLLFALNATGLDEALTGDDPLTVLAPTDEAFGNLPDGVLDGLVADPEALTQVLLYHVLGGREYAYELLKQSTSTTLQGNPVLAVRQGWSVLINGNRVVNANQAAENGVIHVLSGVLVPPTFPPEDPVEINSVADVLALDGRFSTLLTALAATGLDEVLAGDGPFTVLAPTDDAFEALPDGVLEDLLAEEDLATLKSILLYHVLADEYEALKLLKKGSVETVQGESVSVGFDHGRVVVNDSGIINFNIQAPNGIIHSLDQVLLPPQRDDNLLALLEADGRFTTLITALELAGLKDTVENGGPLTILAPTDEAFGALPQDLLDALLADPEGALKNVLLYHVIGGEQSLANLIRERRVETLQTSKVLVRSWFGRTYINRSKVIDSDLLAGNGAVQVLNAVLIPPSDEKKPHHRSRWHR